MSIFKVNAYGIECDRCKKTLENPFTGISLYVGKWDAKEESMNQEWIEHNGKDYCPKCYYIDDDADEVVIRN